MNDIAMLKQMQDEFFDVAKKLVERDGDLMGISFVIAYHGNLAKLDKLSAIGVATPIDDEASWPGLSDHDAIVIAVAWPMTWHERLNVILHAMEPAQRELLTDLLQKTIAILGDDDNSYRTVARPVMHALGCHEKDILAIALKAVCEAVDAFAVINLMTAWVGEGEVAERHMNDSSLADDPESNEMLVSILESQALSRYVFLPLSREPDKDRGKGKFAGWGDQHCDSSEENPGMAGTGRFADLLKPIRATGAA
jgi:hypothetical protein